MSICGKDGGIAPIAPGPLSSQMLTFSVDISVTTFEPIPKKEKMVSYINFKENTKDSKPKKQLPQCININFLKNPLTREQIIEII
jgi:hypothetical protein